MRKLIATLLVLVGAYLIAIGYYFVGGLIVGAGLGIMWWKQ